MTKELPPPELLRKLLRYEPDTGKLFWRERPAEMFKTARDCAAWNTRFAGKRALDALDSAGYRIGHIFYVTHRAHRVIWAMETGEWPEDSIDHINGVRDNNRWVNLREVTNTENNRNARRPSRNTSGAMGVCWNRACGKWRAQIQVDGRNRCLGHFPDLTAAVAARKAAEVEHGFHKNHGRSAVPLGALEVI